MHRILRMVAAFLFALLPITAQAADDPFLGTWRLDKSQSIIGKDPGVASKEFIFAPATDGVIITETVEMASEPGKKHVTQIPFAYGKLTPQIGPGLEALLVARADSHTVYWSAQAKGAIAALLQVNLSLDGSRMTFRYLWAASDPTGSTLNDRYVYVRQ